MWWGDMVDDRMGDVMTCELAIVACKSVWFQTYQTNANVSQRIPFLENLKQDLQNKTWDQLFRLTGEIDRIQDFFEAKTKEMDDFVEKYVMH